MRRAALPFSNLSQRVAEIVSRSRAVERLLLGSLVLKHFAIDFDCLGQNRPVPFLIAIREKGARRPHEIVQPQQSIIPGNQLGGLAEMLRRLQIVEPRAAQLSPLGACRRRVQMQPPHRLGSFARQLFGPAQCLHLRVFRHRQQLVGAIVISHRRRIAQHLPRLVDMALRLVILRLQGRQTVQHVHMPLRNQGELGRQLLDQYFILFENSQKAPHRLAAGPQLHRQLVDLGLRRCTRTLQQHRHIFRLQPDIDRGARALPVSLGNAAANRALLL